MVPLAPPPGYAYEYERTKPGENLLQKILFYSGHLQRDRERSDMKRKYMNTDKARLKDPELTTLFNEVGCGTNI